MSSLQSFSIVIALTNVILGLLALYKGKRSKTSVVFFLLTLSIGLWLIANLLSSVFIGSDLVIFWSRTTNMFATWAVYLFLLLALFFPEDSSSGAKRIAYLSLIFPITLSILIYTKLFISGLMGSAGNYSLTLGGAVYLHLGYLIATIVASIVLLSGKYIKSDKATRGQIRYILFGLGSTAAASLILSAILPLVFHVDIASNYAPLGTVFFIGFTSYAINMGGLFNTKTVLAEFAAVGLILINGAQVLSSPSYSQLLYRSLILLVVSWFGYLLIRSVREEVDRREEVEKLAEEKTAALGELEQRNKNLATLQKISDIVLNETDMKSMAQHIMDGLPDQLEGCIGALLAIVKEGHLVAFAFSADGYTDKVTALVGQDLAKYDNPITRGFNKMHDALLDKKTYHSDDLSEFLSPPIQKPIAMNLQRMIGAKHIEAIPLYAGGEPFGVMTFVFKSPKEEIHSKNLDIADSIADEMSLAIQRAQAFEKLKEANEYLTQLDKMKDEFISMASHELNTPLAAIEGYLSMILDEGMGKVDAKSKEYLTRAYDSSKRLANLILDLLNVSRIEQGRLKMKFAQTNMVDLSESVIHELEIKATAKKIYLKVEGDKAKTPLVWCDPDRIREVITNLTGNAIKFTTTGGVTIKISSDPKVVRVTVSDTGKGISKEGQEKLFQKFSQVNRDTDEQQGTGLGLYISKNYVDLHNGKLWVESEEGKGANFSFELPILDKPPLEVKGAVLEGVQPPAGSPQVVATATASPVVAPAGEPAPASNVTQAPMTAPATDASPVGNTYIPTANVSAPQVELQDDKIPDYIANAWRNDVNPAETNSAGEKTVPSAPVATPAPAPVVPTVSPAPAPVPSIAPVPNQAAPVSVVAPASAPISPVPAAPAQPASIVAEPIDPKSDNAVKNNS